ncbi:hypothetical protein FRC03_012689 [Tulasnella sp. 419]|nr:hypothetical protein FRC03_012689 [Tulasnella sp. 419]
MAPAPKRQKLDESSAEEDNISDEDDNQVVDEGGSGVEASVEDSDEDDASSSADTETEIALAHAVKSKKTAKRKRRAISPTPFGKALTTLLDTSAPSTQPLSLRPAVAKQKNDEKSEMRAKKLLAGERKEKEEKGHIKDVIGGWGGESERALRKVAQRGVVQLFNIIQQAQNTAKEAEEEAKAHRGTGKPSLPAPKPEDFGKNRKSKKKGAKNKDNIIGRGKEVSLGQDDFLDMIRSGGVVSNA